MKKVFDSHKILMRFFIICGLLGLNFSAILSQANLANEITTARDLYNSARFEEAITKLNELIKIENAPEKQRVEAYQLLGFALIAKGYYAQAKEAVEKIIELDPNIQFDPEFVPPKMMKIYYAVWKEKQGSNQIENRPDPGIQTVAILDFDNNSIGTDKQIWEPMGKGLAQMLITDLSRIVKLKVIERERIQYILGELQLQKSEAFDEKSVVQIGKQLGVHAMLFGGFTKIEKTVRIDARLIKVETSELIKAEEITGKAEDFINLEKELALKITKNLEVELSKHEGKLIEKADNRSLEAALAYSEGLSLLDKEDYKNALRKFEEALKYNPKYTAAQKKIDLIKPLVS